MHENANRLGFLYQFCNLCGGFIIVQSDCGVSDSFFKSNREIWRRSQSGVYTWPPLHARKSSKFFGFNQPSIKEIYNETIVVYFGFFLIIYVSVPLFIETIITHSGIWNISQGHYPPTLKKDVKQLQFSFTQTTESNHLALALLSLRRLDFLSHALATYSKVISSGHVPLLEQPSGIWVFCLGSFSFMTHEIYYFIDC